MLKINLKRMLCLCLALIMLGSFNCVAFADVETAEPELSVTTEFYRFDDTASAWVETDKVIAGEDVKARVFVDTSYYAGSPTFLFFYNKDMFEDSYAKDTIINFALNKESGSYADTYNVQANLVLHSNGSRLVNTLVSNGMITSDFAQSHQCVMLSIILSELNCCKFNGDKYLFEYDLIAKENAQPCEGDFFIVPETISTPENPRGVVDVPVGTADTPIGNAVAFFNQEISIVLDSDPVRNYSTVTVDANGGAFANGEETYTEKVLIGSKADVDSFERPVKDNGEFVYWKDKDGQQIRYSLSVGFEDVIIYVMWAVHVPHKNFTTEEYEMNHDGKTYSLIKTGGSSGPVGGEVAFWPAMIPEGFEVNTELSNWEGTIPEGDETLVLKIYYDRVKYKLTYNADGKEVASYDVLYGAELADMPVPDAPEKEGHDFLGWDKEIPATMPAENLTFTAEWEALGYSVIYYSDENTIFASHGGSYGVRVPELKDIPEKEGYEFVGWDKEIPETFPAYNYIVYAVWEAKDYTVTWIIDGVETAETVEYGETITAPDVSEKEGHDFLGWDKEIPATMPAENLTFTAEWEALGYSVIYYSDENTVFASHGGTYGVEVPELNDIPEKEGYEFIGWDKEIPETFPAYNYRVYAVWKAKNYTVTWIIDGAETVTTVACGEAITKPSVSAKDGYAFVGWDTEVPATMPAGNLIFTAVFDAYYLCPDCGEEFFGDEIEEHIAYENQKVPVVTINRNPGSTSLAYGDSIKLTATVADAPEGAKIYWYVDGNKKGEGESFTYTPEGNVEITVKLVDTNGNPLKDSDGNEISDSENVNVKNGFFQKLIAFFKKLFGLTKTIIQAYGRV